MTISNTLAKVNLQAPVDKTVKRVFLIPEAKINFKSTDMVLTSKCRIDSSSQSPCRQKHEGIEENLGKAPDSAVFATYFVPHLGWLISCN